MRELAAQADRVEEYVKSFACSHTFKELKEIIFPRQKAEVRAWLSSMTLSSDKNSAFRRDIFLRLANQ